jgi:hypothetical protein
MKSVSAAQAIEAAHRNYEKKQKQGQQSPAHASNDQTKAEQSPVTAKAA